MTVPSTSTGIPHYPTNPDRFEFDGAVADVFDDMAVRSIPGYQQAHDLMGALVETASLPDYTQVWDFGVSTGKGLETVVAYSRNPLLYHYGVDVSEPMLAQARRRLDPFDVSGLFVHDLNKGLPEELKPGRVSVAIFAWTLQFLPDLTQRMLLLRQTWDALAPGGLMFVFEKFALTDPVVEEVMQRTYMRFRRTTYSLGEIEAKSRALANAMWPWAPEHLTAALNGVGARWEWLYREMNFGGIVARKAP